MSATIFQDALRRLDQAAPWAQLEPEACERLKHPKTLLEVAIPVRMDDGGLEIFTGYRVQYDNLRGPTKGGIRFHPQLDPDELKAMGFWMTCKCALMNLPLGGAKGGVVVNPKELSKLELERLSRGYIRQLADFIGPDTDIPAPDVYTNEKIMGWMMDEYSQITRRRCPAVITGKPLALGGSHGRDDATGRGAFLCLQQLQQKLKFQPQKVRVAIQGFGNAAQGFARLAYQQGYKIVAVSDSTGAVFCDDGFDIPGLIDIKNTQHKVNSVYCNGTVCQTGRGRVGQPEELLTTDADILVPAALGNQITRENASAIKAHTIIEIANGPTTPEADDILNERNVRIVPDILANSGGVTVSYYEWVQNRMYLYWSAEEIHRRLASTMAAEFQAVWQRMEQHELTMRTAAYVHALDRIGQAVNAGGTRHYFNNHA